VGLASLGHLQLGVHLLLRLVAGGADLIARPVGACLVAIEPHLHVLARRLVVKHPAYFEHHRGAVVEPHETGGELLDVDALRDRAAPDAEGALLVHEPVLGNAGDGHGLGMPHEPQSEV